ncbi:hypothetical protein GCM10027190_25020 [Spirosoma areae]
MYGDGELQAIVFAYYAEFPDQFPLHIYPKFIAYHTSIIRKGDPQHIGKERWRTQDAWDIEIRLNSWYTKSQDKPSNQQQANGNQPATLAPGHTHSAHADRYGSADYEKAFSLVDALVNAGGLNGQ